MTRSHLRSQRFTSLSTMVLPYSKRVPPKSFVRSRNMKTEVSKYSRPARTPPSTFLFLHLHLSNSPGPERPSPLYRELSKTSSDGKSQPTNLSAVSSLVEERSFRRSRQPVLAESQNSAALSGAVYKPARSTLSTVISTNRRTVWSYFAAQRSRDSCEAYAVLEPQSCDVL